MMIFTRMAIYLTSSCDPRLADKLLDGEQSAVADVAVGVGDQFHDTSFPA